MNKLLFIQLRNYFKLVALNLIIVMIIIIIIMYKITIKQNKIIFFTY
jgi:hypothetical protein